MYVAQRSLAGMMHATCSTDLGDALQARAVTPTLSKPNWAAIFTSGGMQQYRHQCRL
jgi:hypothetical protein